MSNILSEIKANTEEKVVIVSNFTKVRPTPKSPACDSSADRLITYLFAGAGRLRGSVPGAQVSVRTARWVRLLLVDHQFQVLTLP